MGHILTHLFPNNRLRYVTQANEVVPKSNKIQKSTISYTNKSYIRTKINPKSTIKQTTCNPNPTTNQIYQKTQHPH